MPTTCFDNALWDDLRLRALPASLRAAFPVLVTRLQAYGDGALADRELRVDLLGPKRFAQLADALLEWGWLARNDDGRLTRSGPLAPISADAQRMRQRRHAHIAQEVPDLADIQQQLTAITTAIAPLLSASHRRPSAKSAENFPHPDRTATEREPYNARTIGEHDSESESESDPTETDRNLTDRSDQTPPDNAPRSPLFDKLRAEGVPPAILAEAAGRVGHDNLWKERYVRKVITNLLKDAQQSMPLLGAVPGGAGRAPNTQHQTPKTQHPTPDTLSAGLSLDDLVRKNALLWNEHKAHRGTAGGTP